LKDTFVTPDPALDIFGIAAVQVLATTPGAIVAYARGLIKKSPAVDVALASIENGDYSYGFVAKSLICRKFDGVESYAEGSYHHIYSPGGSHPYLPIKLKGIKIARTRDAAQDTVLAAFIDFLVGREGVPAAGGTPLGTALLEQFCLTPVRHYCAIP
jgi:ABC-type molybdate transport system substrate-binding protein